MLDDPRSNALVENFAGQWLYLRNLRTVAPDTTRFPEFDDNLRQALPPRDRAVLRQPAPGGPQRARPAARRLHVRQRTAGAALRNPQRLRQPLPPRDARRRTPARSARPRQHPHRHLLSAPHLAGGARQVAAREPARRAAAARRRPTSRSSPRTTARRSGRRRCASGWRGTGPAPPARPATRRSTRSASPSRTSTRSAAGARTMATRRCRRARRRRSTRRGRFRTGRRSTARAAFRDALLREPWATRVRGDGRGEAADLRPRPGSGPSRRARRAEDPAGRKTGTNTAGRP